MAQSVLVLVTSGVLLTSAAYAATTIKHSGMIITTNPNAGTITLEEMGPWTGSGQAFVRQSIRLTPGTTVVLVARSNEPGPGGWPGGFKETPLSQSDLQPGDHVTVAAEHRGGELVANSIAVFRMSAAKSGRSADRAVRPPA